MAGQRTRIFGWCEPSAYCRKHDGTQLTGSLHCRRFKIGQPTGRANRSRTCRPGQWGHRQRAVGGGPGPIYALATAKSVTVPLETVLELAPEQAA
jgi:hypothetical protein